MNRVSIGSDNGLSPIWRQAIIWTNAGILLIKGTNFSESRFKIQNFSFMKMHLKTLSEKWQPFCPWGGDELTHWGRVTHICISKLTIIGSDNGLSPDRRQAIIWINAGILLIVPLETNFNEILIEIYLFSFRKMHLKMSSGNWQPFCLGLNVLTDKEFQVHPTPVMMMLTSIPPLWYPPPSIIAELTTCKWG